MRIAVSGSHASGKTTLIEAFLSRNPGYAYEPEPYLALQEAYGEHFSDQPDVEDFERQLELQAEMLARCGPHEDAIFERCPVDFLAYMLVVAERRRSSFSHDLDVWIESVNQALGRLDVIVFLPLDLRDRIDVGDAEDPELRAAVDNRLHDIFLDDELDLFARRTTVVVEARGSVQERVQILEKTIRERSGLSPSAHGT